MCVADVVQSAAGGFASNMARESRKENSVGSDAVTILNLQTLSEITRPDLVFTTWLDASFFRSGMSVWRA